MNINISTFTCARFVFVFVRVSCLQCRDPFVPFVLRLPSLYSLELILRPVNPNSSGGRSFSNVLVVLELLTSALNVVDGVS